MARRFLPVCGLSVKQHHWLRNKWRSMRSRCRADHPAAKNYFARGIRVEWPTFESFAEYVRAELGFPDLESGVKWTLDRIDNDRGYAPGNIRWTTYTENLRNRRGNVYVEYKGERVLLAELAERFGLSYFLVHDRIARQGWTAEQAVETPRLSKTERIRKPVWSHELKYTHGGETKRVREWAEQFGVPHHLLRDRLSKGWPFEEAVRLPASKANGSRRAAARYEFRGQLCTTKEIAKAAGLNEGTIRYRIAKIGLTAEQAAAPRYTVGKFEK